MAQGLKNIYSWFIEAGLDIFDKSAPDWMKTHPELQKRKNINKVFPSFGLKNFRETVTVENTSTKAEEEFIRNVLDTLADQVERMAQNLHMIHDELPEEADPAMVFLMSNYHGFLKAVKKALHGASIKKKDGKTKLLITVDVSMGGKTIIRTGESVFKVFNKINELTSSLLKKYPELKTKWNLMLPNPDSLLVVKQFHSNHLPSRDYQIVFSSEGDTGAWDIATMSMRGVSSCQRWGDETHRTCLIGSILSRYVGIIYFTSGSQEGKYGEKMIRRCVVRFGIHKKTGEKFIIMDKMYDAYDAMIASYFLEALKKRTNLKVLDHSKDSDNDLELPSTWDIEIPEEAALKKLKPSELPYADAPLLTGYNYEPTDITNREDLAYHLSTILDRVNTIVKAHFQELEGASSVIVDTTRVMLSKHLDDTISRVVKNNLGHKLSFKFIRKQMLKITDSFYDYDIETILARVFPHRAAWTVERHLYELATTIPQIRDTFERVVRDYKLVLNEVLDDG